MLNVYTTFHRADGHTVKLHADQWEGQVFQISPGNLYSEVRKIALDPRAAGTVRLTLGRKIPPIAMPADTRVRQAHAVPEPAALEVLGTAHLRRSDDPPSARLREGEGRLLPGQLRAGAFRDRPSRRLRREGRGSRPGRPSGRRRGPGRARSSRRPGSPTAFPGCSSSPSSIRRPTTTIPTPWTRPTTGPYGQVIMTELIPYIETHFRAIREPWARHPLGRVHGRLGVARAPGLPPRRFRRHLLRVPRPRGLPLHADRQHLRLGQRLAQRTPGSCACRCRGSATPKGSSARRWSSS